MRTARRAPGSRRDLRVCGWKGRELPAGASQPFWSRGRGHSEPSGSDLPSPSRDLTTFFTWESPSPFQVLPNTGLLEPGQACQIKVTFQPLMAVIYDVQATCWYGEGSKQKSSIQLRGIGEA